MKNGLTKAAIFVALGLILPQVLGHLFGLQGTWILPMHFVVILSGIFCGSLYASLTGIIIVSSSYLLTGMPAVIMLPQLAVELVVLGAISGWLSRRINIYIVIISSYLIGRIVFSIIFLCFLPLPALYLILLQGLLGLAVQLAIIPLLARIFRKEINCDYENKAKQMIKNGFSCVIIKNKRIISESKEFGIRPLLNAGNGLKEAYVVDKIIGKAAAIVLVHYDIGKVYADIISETAIEVFENNKIKYDYRKKVKVVLNSDHTAPCPMETLVEKIDSIKEGYEALIKFVNKKPA